MICSDKRSCKGFLDPINPGSKGLDWIGLQDFLSGGLILVVAARLVS